MPGHPALLEILKAARFPLAATSTNRSGLPAIVKAEEAVAFSAEVDHVLDGGDLSGKESTVVDVRREPPEILREGALGAKLILETLE